MCNNKLSALSKQTDMKKKRFLFFLVHPAKFHFHKVQINTLIERGHIVDVVIITKDILEDLVIEEGWTYTNIFPEGRKVKFLHPYVGAFISVLKTVYRLLKATKKKKYDLFIGDLLTFIGHIKKVPSLLPTDDVLSAVPEGVFLNTLTNYLIAPQITDVGKFRKKKIGYNGYKALAHLHPNHFKPDKSRLDEELQGETNFFLIRCTGFFATHDLKKRGISDEVLYKIIKLLEPLGKIFITSEKNLPKDLQKYKFTARKTDIMHYLYYAKLFISDSTTMSTEAAVLGTPAVEFDEYAYEIDQMTELEEKYKLVHCYRTHEENDFLKIIEELFYTKDLDKIYRSRRDKLIGDFIDVSSFLIWFFENYPQSKDLYLDNPTVQERFRT